MRFYNLILGSIILGTIGVFSSVDAANYHEPEKVNLVSTLDELPDNTPVIDMGDGYMIGESGFGNVNQLTGEINQENYKNTDKPVFKLGDVRDSVEGSTTPSNETIFHGSERSINSNLLVRSGQAPTKVKILYAGEKYLSKTFNGSGWRFAGYVFLPSQNPYTGYYLKWMSLADDGRIGTPTDAQMTATYGGIRGRTLTEGVAQWYDGFGGRSTYWTYNPQAGTQYMVSNVEP